MTLTVYMAQNPELVEEGTGIGRVVHAMWRYLPKHGIEFVSRPEQAELRVAHANGTAIEDLDILHTHGLYWTGDPGSGNYSAWHHRLNGLILADARRARAITVPSEWVAVPFRRDMKLEPTVIGHGINLDEWPLATGTRGQYVLWNKNRSADVCDPTAAYELALKGVPVLSTFAPNGKDLPLNMRVCGSLPKNAMRALVQEALIYLATTKETFGIGTLEAMASGVPVLGYAHGGTLDLVRHGVEGWLVEPGDVDGLYVGVQAVLENWPDMRAAARARAEEYSWDRAMQHYAELYHRVAKERGIEKHGVTIVITNHNYGSFVNRALNSALTQTVPPDEIIVVDDGSTDDSLEQLPPVGPVHGWTEILGFSSKVKVISQTNQGVAAARNAGIAESTQPYVVCLDADDALDPRFLSATLPAMKQDRALGIAYTGLMVCRPDGTKTHSTAWPVPFDWDLQSKGGVPPGNCIPSACLFRRRMWERAGGFKQEYAPAEDAEFWTRGLSVGFMARQTTQDPLFLYHVHEGSASRSKPWVGIDTWLPWIRDKHFPMAAPAKQTPLVRSYSAPLVLVEMYISFSDNAYRAIDAYRAIEERLEGQTFRNWVAAECGVWEPERGPSPMFFYQVSHVGELTPTSLEDELRAYVESGGRDTGMFGHICRGEGGRAMGCCGNKAKSVAAAQQGLRQMNQSIPGQSPDATIATSAFEPPPVVNEVQLVRLRFTGKRRGTATYKWHDPRSSGKEYRAGDNDLARFINAYPQDVPWLLGLGEFERVERPAPEPAKPEPPKAEPQAGAMAAIAEVLQDLPVVEKPPVRQKTRRRA